MTTEQFDALMSELRGIRAALMTRPVPAATPAATGTAPTNFPNYGKAKGAPIRGASKEDLNYYANGARRSIEDPAKAQWHAKERALLAALEAEAARQMASGEATPTPAPSGAPSDEDIPF